MSIRTSPRLAAIPRYEPGLTTAEVLARYGIDSAVKLASNESPFPPMPEVVEVVAAGMQGLNRYPDGPARALRRALAERHGVGPDEVVIGNGSCELILLAGQALLDPGTTVVHADPSFALYPHLAAAAGAEGIAVPLADDLGHDLDAMAARGRRAHAPGDRLQPEQPDRRLPLGRRDRALRRLAPRGPGDPRGRGLLRLRGPPGRRAHHVAGARAARTSW